MEFEEMKRIWLEKEQQMFYAINENALHNRIIAKKNKIGHIVNFSEWLLIIVNLSTGVFISVMTGWSSSNIFLYMMAGWMILTAAYVLMRRINRLRQTPRYDRSVGEELQYAIATAAYQVNLSGLMRLNVVPVALLTVLGIWNAGKSFWMVAVILLFFGLVYYFSGWEHRIYKNKKKELELLSDKLKA